MRAAILDLGTNTFHLLIAEQDLHGRLATVYRERIYVKLATEGLARIGEAPMQRAEAALRVFRSRLDEHRITRLRAVGTAAMRTASNGSTLLRYAREELAIDVEIIDGNEEARLIHLGTMQAIPRPEGRILIMDIGGGSVEYIIADAEQVLWAASYPIGVGVLHRDFHHSDPMSHAEGAALIAHLEHTLPELRSALLEYPVQQLVGASGSFEVMELAMGKSENRLYSPFRRQVFDDIYQELRHSTHNERLTLHYLPAQRVDMIVVAAELIRYTLELCGADEIWVSAYALKEGVLAEMLLAIE